MTNEIYLQLDKYFNLICRNVTDMRTYLNKVNMFHCLHNVPHNRLDFSTGCNIGGSTNMKIYLL